MTIGDSRIQLTCIDRYSNALSQPATADELDIIERNRSLAFLKIKQFDAALSDTGFSSFNRKLSEKALYRAAEALYHLRRYTECCEVLELLRSTFLHNSQALAILDRARSRCLEQTTAVYDFASLQAETKKLQVPHLDHDTYIGPVEVKRRESKGRGLFVTKAVKAGDLLLCEKAFSCAYPQEWTQSGSRMTLLLNPETNRGFLG